MKLSFAGCTFDSDARLLERDGKAVSLSGKAFQLLEVLLAARPNPLRKEELFDRLWPDTFVAETNLASLIRELRAAIGDDARKPHLIRTAHRFGYAFIGEVVEVRGEKSSIDSIAVLPFSNLSQHPDCDYLADGIAESLINTLSGAAGLRVTSRATSFRFRGREDELDTLRRELNVRAILVGRLRLAEGDVMLQAELIDLRQKTQIWGSQFRRRMSRVFELQEELSREIATQLQIRLDGDSEKLTRRYTSNSEAYQLYLRGRHHWNRRTLEGIERGVFYFQSAIQIDPGYAPAYSGLADSYIALASRDLLSPLQLLPKAEEAARKALELDSSLAEAHASIAAVNQVFRWNWPEARKAFEESLRLNPSYVTARVWYAQALAQRGHTEAALDQLSKAAETDPLSFMLNTQMAVVHYLARDYEAAERLCAVALEINPHHEPAHFTRGLAFQQRGLVEEARTALTRSYAISKGEPHAEAALGYLEASIGEISEARTRLARLIELESVRHVSPVHVALIETGMGEGDAAISNLQRAVESRSGWLVYMNMEPRFDPLRSDPRFSDVLKTIQPDEVAT